MKKLILLFLILPFLSINAQETKQDSFDIPEQLKSFTPYACIANVFSVSENGMYISDFIPRAGIRGKWYLDEQQKYNVFMKVEFGFNLVSRNDFVHFSADPGHPQGKSQQSVFTRQGYIGISTPYGNLSMGRQWGVHYTLAGNLDDTYFGAGIGIGVYNAGTDGGISGTGRADQALKYELNVEKFYFGLQGQFRNETVNDQFFADTYGVASSYDFDFVKIGASYNKVLDGVEAPVEIESKINDELVAILIDFKRKNWHLGIMPEYFVNHELNDQGEYIKGFGGEYSFRYHFGKDKKWRFVNNSYYLQSLEKDSKYVLSGFTFNIARRFSDNVAVIFAFTIDNSTNKDGSRPDNHILGAGFYYTFNYPVP